MTKLLIYGEHNSGKTHLLEKILEKTRCFILIDSTCEEGEKSIVNKAPKLLDIVVKPNEVNNISFENIKRVGIDVSWYLEMYLENHSLYNIRQFLEDIHHIALFLKANRKLSEKYVVALDEIPLFPRILKNISDYNVMATGNTSIINYKYIHHFFEHIIKAGKDIALVF